MATAFEGKFDIKEAVTDEEFLFCYPCVRELRTHVTEEEYLPRIHLQLQENFHLMYIVDPDTKKVGSILGYREENKLFSGKTIYVDDVSSMAESRGKGFAGALLRWVKQYALDNGFDALTLDSGCHAGRYNAHRLYLNTGFNISCFHFDINLNQIRNKK